LTVDPASPVPLGEQVRRGIRRAIAEGELRVGDPLPPVRQLAGDVGVNLNTIARAYRELEREGLLRTARGRGTVVAADRSTTRVPKSELRERLRDLFADVRLAGMGERDLRKLLLDELGRRT
jgi:DNA-binding transcriptional regulator YhcF (GntR family)